MAGRPTGAVAGGRRCSSGPSQRAIAAPRKIWGCEGVVRICASQPLIRPLASAKAAPSGRGPRKAWLIIASPKKVQSLSATQPNEVRSDDEAVTIALVADRRRGTNTPE